MAEQNVEGRLAAVLAHDVVGYSRLMAADEEGTLARLNACRRDLWEPTIAEHRGRVVKRIGDATVRMLSYNGSIPGPTLKVREGSELVVDIENLGRDQVTR